MSLSSTRPGPTRGQVVGTSAARPSFAASLVKRTAYTVVHDGPGCRFSFLPFSFCELKHWKKTHLKISRQHLSWSTLEGNREKRKGMAIQRASFLEPGHERLNMLLQIGQLAGSLLIHDFEWIWGCDLATEIQAKGRVWVWLKLIEKTPLILQMSHAIWVLPRKWMSINFSRAMWLCLHFFFFQSNTFKLCDDTAVVFQKMFVPFGHNLVIPGGLYYKFTT